MIKWLVERYSNKSNRWVYCDEVYFKPDCDAIYIRDSLVNHDGYPYNIRVTRL